MLQFSATTRVFVHRFDTDMRKSFDGLHAIVKNTFGLNVLDGDLFVFFNRLIGNLISTTGTESSRENKGAGVRVGL